MHTVALGTLCLPTSWYALRGSSLDLARHVFCSLCAPQCSKMQIMIRGRTCRVGSAWTSTWR